METHAIIDDAVMNWKLPLRKYLCSNVVRLTVTGAFTSIVEHITQEVFAATSAESWGRRLFCALQNWDFKSEKNRLAKEESLAFVDRLMTFKRSAKDQVTAIFVKGAGAGPQGTNYAVTEVSP
ncbi:hypothetical protein HDU85_006028 [Gaertneriomyces sp. JEL0708]|nr:hypothetical protein HDU85_006028 [Gaertneriomyces sp. JEL0708]